MRGFIRKFLDRAIRRGRLELVDSTGTVLTFGESDVPPVRARFTSAEAERRVALMPELALGEAFMDGGFVMEQGSIYDVLMLLMSNTSRMPMPWWHNAALTYRYLTRRIRQMNTPLRAKRNVSSHYDLTGELYRLFLDPDMQYSCAYFESPDATLEAAQLAKKRHLAAKLDLKPGQRVLDIGSGWGGLGLYLARHFDVDVVGITLSEEQLTVATQRAEEAGLADRIEFRLQDYRKTEGPFDRIVSVGMFEHVGVGHYMAYFNACRDLLTSDGIMLLHSIGRFHGPGETAAWLQKYIFPGGYIPALSEVVPKIEKSGMMMTDIEILRLHYAETLRNWRTRFMANRDKVKALYDERFCLMWEFYLASSEAAFREGGMMNFQIQICRRQETLPLTRGYINATEDDLRLNDGGPPRPRLELAGE